MRVARCDHVHEGIQITQTIQQRAGCLTLPNDDLHQEIEDLVKHTHAKDDSPQLKTLMAMPLQGILSKQTKSDKHQTLMMSSLESANPVANLPVLHHHHLAPRQQRQRRGPLEAMLEYRVDQ